MASFAKQCSLVLLLALLASLHTHARESQFFNKMSGTNNNVPNNNENNQQQQQQQQEPDFLPDNENAYGLYGHETSQLPPSATLTTTEPPSKTTTNAPYNALSGQPSHKYLPKNYNPTAYVTVPEDEANDSSSTFTEDKSFNSHQEEEEEDCQQEEEEEEEEEEQQTNNRNNYYTRGSSFNSQPQGFSDTRLGGGGTLSSRGNYFDNGNNGFRPQGMSDTRSLGKGQYFYNVNTEKYSTKRPYESLRGVRATNDQFSNRNYYANSEHRYDFNNRENSMGGYQNFQNGHDRFQNEDFNLP